LLDRSFSPSSTCHGVASGEDGTPPLFSKPFTGIYLFAPQKDKCHSNFEKYLNAQVYMSFFTTYPHWEQSFSKRFFPRPPHALMALPISGTHPKGRVTRHCRVVLLTTGCRRLVLPIAKGIRWEKPGKFTCIILFSRYHRRDFPAAPPCLPA